jgi:hypothetical protein
VSRIKIRHMCGSEQIEADEGWISDTSTNCLASIFGQQIKGNVMKKKIEVTPLATRGWAADDLFHQAQDSGRVFGYVQSIRFHKLGKRTLVYRKPGAAKRMAFSKPMFYVVALLLAVSAAGYVASGHDPVQKVRGIVPASVVPSSSIKRLITISALGDAIITHANTGGGNHHHAGLPYPAV